MKKEGKMRRKKIEGRIKGRRKGKKIIRKGMES